MYCVNDFLTIMIAFRIVPIIRFLAKVFFFRDILIQRVLDQYQSEETFSFTFNGILKGKPYHFFFWSLIFSVAFFSFVIRIAEIPLLLQDNEQGSYPLDFNTFIWMTFITMATVGYGDVFPRTPLGRFLTFILCVWGLFLMSIIVIILF